MDEKITFCTFYLANKHFGIDILDIKEINTENEFTAIDHAPSYLKGYVNIRGNLCLIADIASLLGLKETKITKNSKLLLLKDSVENSFGILVEEVGDTLTVEKREIIDRRESKAGNIKDDRRQSNTSISNGVVKLNDELLITVNARNIVSKLL